MSSRSARGGGGNRGPPPDEQGLLDSKEGDEEEEEEEGEEDDEEVEEDQRAAPAGRNSKRNVSAPVTVGQNGRRPAPVKRQPTRTNGTEASQRPLVTSASKKSPSSVASAATNGDKNSGNKNTNINRIVQLETQLLNTEPHWCTITPLIVAVAVVTCVSLAFLVPGILMRLEAAPSPTPYIAVNLCPSGAASLAYVGTAAACQSNATNAAQAQSFPLNQVTIINGVQYVPTILRPAGAVSGEITLELHGPDNAILLQFTQSLQVQPTDNVVELDSFFDAGNSILIYRSNTAAPHQNTLCGSLFGCWHALSTSVSKLILNQAAYVYPATPLLTSQFEAAPIDSTATVVPVPVAISTDAQPIGLVSSYANYVTDLTLVITRADITLDSAPPASTGASTSTIEAYVALEQATLSNQQKDGVILMNVGIGIFCVGIALGCLSCIFRSRKWGDAPPAARAGARGGKDGESVREDRLPLVSKGGGSSKQGGPSHAD